MAIQEYVDCVSQVSSLSKEDLIEFFLYITKTEMCLSKKTTESFVFSGSRYIIEAPEKNEEKIK
jgi:hypothetical protein